MVRKTNISYMPQRFVETFFVVLTIYFVISYEQQIWETLVNYGIYHWLIYSSIIVFIITIIHAFSRQDKLHIVVSNDRTRHNTSDILERNLEFTDCTPLLFMETAWISRYTYRKKLEPTKTKVNMKLTGIKAIWPFQLLIKKYLFKNKCENAYFKAIQRKLEKQGWKREEAYDCKFGNNSFGFRYDIWINETSKQIIIAFRGTEFFKPFSLLANFHWFSRYIIFTKWISHYDKIKDHFPTLISEVNNNHPNHSVYLTGHSLGGGLAIHCSYCINEIKQVYAYDASPVTGWFEISSSLRKQCTENLVIHTFYESGELLFYLRKFTQLSYLLNTTFNRNPHFIEYRANFYRGMWPISNHGMAHIVEGFEDASNIPMTKSIPEKLARRFLSQLKTHSKIT